MTESYARADMTAKVIAKPGAGWDDEASPAIPRAWSREEALDWRSRNPSLSPWRVVATQGLAGLACAAFVWAITRHAEAAWSALYGAAAVVIPSALLARGMTRGMRNPLAAAAGFMFWEMLKIGVAIAMLLIAVRVVPNLNWPALLVTMVVCIKVNWIALLWRGRRSDNKA
jgi:ATP synthase protein I